MGINIFDIAKEAEVSIATVSKVVNNTGRISDKTRKKVLEIIEKHNYTPNSLATALTGKFSYTLGLIIPNLANPFFGEIAKSVEDRARELGFSVMICSTDYDADREASYFTLLQKKRVDGVIILSGFEDQQTITRNLVKPNMPVALIARDIPTISINSVSIDDFVGGYEAAKHLIGLGHRRMGLIVENIRCAKERVRGFNQALEEHDLQLDESLVLLGEATVPNGKKLALQLLSGDEPPTAIFATNDLLAIGTIQAANEHGLKVPQDVSVIGFDNTMLATITDPPLTTIAQPMEQMGRQIVDLLVQELKGDVTHKQRIVLLPELVVRKSTGLR
ncbi:LacI family DNA-binding transcriptional regulator [Paenibacillus validus]|uniref:LacI family DNA-binding transcriptional regulator n=1 Tax=Paenibacillus TaxID=44249 RepID=UPI000FD91C0D|nr:MULTISPECIES: LacI family DNA-binding transcriptional regulator [Paenibacillus]MED4599309.1 LacI family DNA-binding transcriptional regulator [Paenibacillus validus]MED4606379.1 LacI family DNA-binding transcriptional regulator [Paenibacillus validus]